MKARRSTRRSQKQRTRTPYPPTRHEADETFRPLSPTGRAESARLYRMNVLGLLAERKERGAEISRQQAHEAILNALYDEHGNLRVDA